MSSLSWLDFLPYEIVYLLVNEYFGDGPLFQLIILQFVCKRLRKAVREPGSRYRTRVKELRNTAPEYRKNIFSKIGAEACQYVSVACWFRDRMGSQPNEEWCRKAARSKHSINITTIFLLIRCDNR